MVASDGADVVIVCTANRCRSPLAAALLRDRAAAAGLPWMVGSAGVHARRGDVTEPEAVEVLREIGVAATAEPARRLDAAALAGAGLVLTAERRHRSHVLELAPAKVGRVYTLLEFARLVRAAGAPAAGVSDVSSLAALADSARAAAGPGGVVDDLADPIGGPLDVFRECRDTVAAAVDAIVTAAGRR